MLALKTPILAIAMLFTCIPFAFAQDDQNQQIEGRLGEVENMIKEERATIALLERQLSKAEEDGDNQRQTELKDEIDAAYTSLSKLEELRDQFEDLNNTRERKRQNAQRRFNSPLSMRGRGNVPRPTIGGNEDGMDLKAAQQRQKRLQQQKQNREPSRPPQGNWSPSVDRGNRGGAARRPNESFRLRSLKTALAGLQDAGEVDLANQVESLIDREERNQNANAPARNPNRANRNPSVQGNPAGDSDGPTMADGPAMADGGNARGNRNPRNNRNTRGNPPRVGGQPQGPAGQGNSSADNSNELDAMEDEIERLRDKLRALRNRQNGDG